MYTRRPPGSVARYRMLKHELRQENPDLAAMVQKTRRRQLEHEGVATVRYTLQALTPLPLYTKIEVTLPPPPAKVELHRHNIQNIVKLRQGSGKERQGKARMAKGERP